jgi:ribosomal protein S18 acetylase RimI-like enzyme
MSNYINLSVILMYIIDEQYSKYGTNPFISQHNDVSMELRTATKEDSEEIEAFLKRNNPDDYILDVIDRWLDEDTVFLAEEDGIIGMNRLKYSPDGEAWLGGMRVDKNHRRKGIATVLTEKCLREGGTKKARLFTSEDNIPAWNHVRTMGFVPKGHYTLMYAEIGDEPPCEIEKCAAWERLCDSEVLRKNNFLLPRSFTFYRAAPHLIGGSYRTGDGYAVVERVDWEEGSFWKGYLFEIVYFEGEKIIDGLKYLASKNNHTKLWALIPREEELISILRKKGFVYEKWAKRGVVLEKIL